MSTGRLQSGTIQAEHGQRVAISYSVPGIRAIPEAAWNSVVNSRLVPLWITRCQSVGTDKVSGIVSDAKEYTIETMGCLDYPMDLLVRVVAVSLETKEIVNFLPVLEIDEPPLDRL